MAHATKTQSGRRSFFATLGRAVDAHLEFERLSNMSDESLAALNLTRDQIPQHIIARL